MVPTGFLASQADSTELKVALLSVIIPKRIVTGEYSGIQQSETSDTSAVMRNIAVSSQMTLGRIISFSTPPKNMHPSICILSDVIDMTVMVVYKTDSRSDNILQCFDIIIAYYHTGMMDNH